MRLSPQIKRILSLSAILIVALSLRLYRLPHPDVVTGGDEINYTSSGMLLWEGMLPGYQIAPAGVSTWLSWLYCAGSSANEFIRISSMPAPPPLVERPYHAIQNTLFDLYQNMLPLKWFLVCIALCLSLISVAAAFKIGARKSGLTGGIFAAITIACLPILVFYSVLPTAYIFAWSLTIFSLYCASANNKPRWTASGILLGMAIATRIDMILVLPVVLWELLYQDQGKPSLPKIGRFLFSLTLTMVLISPWMIFSGLEIVRAIIMVRFASPHTFSLAQNSKYLLMQGCNILIALVITIGLPLAPKGKKAFSLVLWGYMLFLISSMFLRIDIDLTSSRYDAPFFISSIVAAPLAIGFLRRFVPFIGSLSALCLLILGSAIACREAYYDKQHFAPCNAIEWIQRHVPENTPVYIPQGWTVLLPTKESSDRQWENVNNLSACRRKFNSGATHIGLTTTFSPRAYCEEIMHVEKAEFRRWYVLGGERDGSRQPRYDVTAYPISQQFGRSAPQCFREFITHGGVFVWRAKHKIPGLDQWICASWKSPSKLETEYIYCSPEVRTRLKR